MIKSKNSYSSFYGLYGPFESNPWNSEDSEEEELNDETGSVSIEKNNSSLIILSLQLNLILPKLPIISIIDYILYWIFNSEILNLILFFPISFSISVKLLEYFKEKDLLKILGFTSFYILLPKLFHIYHYFTETSLIGSIFSYFLLIGISFLVFSIAIYNWIRFCYTLSTTDLSPTIPKSKSMPILRKKSSLKITKTKSHYFQNTNTAVPVGNWSARYE